MQKNGSQKRRPHLYQRRNCPRQFNQKEMVHCNGKKGNHKPIHQWVQLKTNKNHHEEAWLPSLQSLAYTRQEDINKKYATEQTRFYFNLIFIITFLCEFSTFIFDNKINCEKCTHLVKKVIRQFLLIYFLLTFKARAYLFFCRGI